MLNRTYKSLPNDLSRSASVASNSHRASMLEKPVRENTVLREKVATILRLPSSEDDTELADRLTDTLKTLTFTLKVYKSRYKKLKLQFRNLAKAKANADDSSENSSIIRSPKPSHSDDEIDVPFKPWNSNQKAPLLPIVRSDDNLLTLDDLRSQSVPPKGRVTIFHPAQEVQSSEVAIQTSDMEGPTPSFPKDWNDYADETTTTDYKRFLESQVFRDNEILSKSLVAAKNEICVLKQVLMEKEIQVETLNGISVSCFFLCFLY